MRQQIWWLCRREKIKFKWVYYSFFDRFICFRVIIHSAEKLFGTYRWPERKNYTNYDVLFYWMVIDKLVAILFLLLPFNINSNFLAKWSLFRSLFTVSEQFRWITPAPSLFHYDIKFTSGVFQNFLCFFLVYIDIMANGIEYAVFMCVWNAWKSVWLTLVIYNCFTLCEFHFVFFEKKSCKDSWLTMYNWQQWKQTTWDRLAIVLSNNFILTIP